MSRGLQRGVSLIEALVAFAIMAFGMMAVVGMQATMRSNADLARQRAEAVRLAQDSIEEWRGFSSIGAAANRTFYGEITGSATRTVNGTNADYIIARSAMAAAAVAGTVSPQGRGVVVEVTWTDRNNQAQLVRLTSFVTGLAPELSASLVLSTATNPAVSPQNRHPAIPPSARPVPVCTDCSGWVPPGQSSGSPVAWLFNNRTAEITVCNVAAGTTTADLALSGTLSGGCGSGRSLLLSGFIRQAPDQSSNYAAGDAANPTGPDRDISLKVDRTLPTPLADIPCFRDTPLSPSNARAYFCAIPLETGSNSWSGDVTFFRTNSSTPKVATELDEDDTDRYRVCRYYTADTGVNYSGKSAPLTNQNYLIIQAGNGTIPFTCPAGTASPFTPATFLHQPR